MAFEDHPVFEILHMLGNPNYEITEILCHIYRFTSW